MFGGQLHPHVGQEIARWAVIRERKRGRSGGQSGNLSSQAVDSPPLTQTIPDRPTGNAVEPGALGGRLDRRTSPPRDRHCFRNNVVGIVHADAPSSEAPHGCLVPRDEHVEPVVGYRHEMPRIENDLTDQELSSRRSYVTNPDMFRAFRTERGCASR